MNYYYETPIMKHLTATALMILVFSTAAFSQHEYKSKIGLNYSFLNKGASILEPRQIGAASRSISQKSGIGFAYSLPVNQSFDFETGIEYSLFKITTIAAITDPTLPQDTSYSNLSLIQVPISLRLTFARYFYVTGGAILDLDMRSTSPIKSQSGIGAMAGLGVNYTFTNGISIFTNPFLKIHSLMPFGSWKNHQRILESGMRMGIAYQF